MSNISQSDVAAKLCEQIDGYVKNLKGGDFEDRNKLMSRMHNLTVLTAVLPLVVTAISGFAYIVTQQVLAFLASLVDVIPPFYISKTKTDIEFHNKCSEVKYSSNGLKGKINRLAAIGQLKDPILTEIYNEMEKLEQTFQQLSLIR
jgi:hypothetical protein